MILKKDTNRIRINEVIGQMKSVVVISESCYLPIKQVPIRYNEEDDKIGEPENFYITNGDFETDLVFYPKANKDYEVEIIYYPPLKRI